MAFILLLIVICMMLEGHYSTRENLMSVIYVHEDKPDNTSSSDDKVEYSNKEDYFTEESGEPITSSSAQKEQDAEDLLREITNS